MGSSDREVRSGSKDDAASIDSLSLSGSESREMMRDCRRTGIERGRGDTSDSSSGGGRAIPRSDDSFWRYERSCRRWSGAEGRTTVSYENTCNVPSAVETSFESGTSLTA